MARVLIVIRPDRGGAFNHVAALSAALADRGHAVAVCGPLEHRRDELEVPVIPLAIPREVSPLADLAAVGGFARIVRRFRPDLVHAHGSKGSLVARLARFASPRTPVLCTPHLYPFANHFESRRRRALYKLVERLLAPLATRVICVCRFEQRLAETVGPVARTRLVYNGVPAVPRVSPHPVFEQLKGREPIVCSVAELRDSKGIESLVAAMPAILARHPRAALVVAGDGSERAKLELKVQELDLSESVRLIGDTPGPASVLSGSAAFVNPAYAEAFPYTIIEAMSFPLPVVATDVGGSGEAIEDGLTGLLVEPRNPGALAGAVDRLATDAGLGERLAAAARERWREEFTVARMIDSTLAVYAEVGVGAADGRLS